MSKKLRLSEDNKVLFGLCGGIGEYFDIDPNVIRILFIVITAFGNFLFGLYFILTIFIDWQSESDDKKKDKSEKTIENTK